MGKDPFQRQRAYREYVSSNRDKEEQEIREKVAKGAIGAAGFREQMDKKAIEIKRPRKGRPGKQFVSI
ncbi:MAG: hypothetical protein QME90_11165 [Thermodesulfobacteriota bacterium]|nr:hypothetical protein [Thermodesulfobacteriota bacterium]